MQQSAGIGGARCGPTGVAHHQNIEVGSPGADGMVNHCRRSSVSSIRCCSKRMGSSSKNYYPSLRKTKSHPIRKLSSHLMNHGFLKNIDFRSSHGINLGYVHGIVMGIYYNGMLLSGNQTWQLNILYTLW